MSGKLRKIYVNVQSDNFTVLCVFSVLEKCACFNAMSQLSNIKTRFTKKKHFQSLKHTALLKYP